MKKVHLIFLLLLGVVLAGALEWKSDLIFSHKFHAEEAEASCTDCHASAAESITGADDLLPSMEACGASCHDVDDEEGCTLCHQQPDDPVLLPRITDYASKFNHQLHQQNGAECLTCHSGVEMEEEVGTTIHLPGMDGCMACHETPEQVQGCYLCHETSEDLRPVDHTAVWIEAHGMNAESTAQNCAGCHTESYCTECHQGENLHGESHPPEFIATHAQSYQVMELDCANCHEDKSFCVDCHVNVNGIVPPNHLAADWRGRQHAAEARLNFDSCTICHQDGDATCAECHN